MSASNPMCPVHSTPVCIKTFRVLTNCNNFILPQTLNFKLNMKNYKIQAVKNGSMKMILASKGM